MGLEHRPYVGTWALNKHKLVQHTPDALVFVNGDTSVPGCAKCNGRIDLQQYITSISVDAGTDTNAHSSQVSLSIPRHVSDSMLRDAEFILRPGLEVHIYEKGYFPVEGMYGSLATQVAAKKSGNVTGQSVPRSILQSFGVDNLTLSDMINYPYYHVFHGVVTGVDHAYSGGFWTGTIHCQGMLWFWSYQQISTSASVFGARPTNSKLKVTLIGHTFTRMTPYEIIYTLFHDVAGAAAGVGFALGSKTNQKARSAAFGQNLFSMTLKYWAKRFSESPNKLRLYGVSGVMFSAAQAAFLGRLSTSQVGNVLRGRFPGREKKSKNLSIQSTARALGFFSKRLKDALVWAERTGARRGGDQNLNIAQMQAFATDIAQFGSINLWESSYRSKLDMVNSITQITGFEFYQDVDGDLVYKPPMYNLDTSSSRIYRIEDIDIISINFSEKEPTATFMTIRGSHFKNLRGMGMDNEWGTRGQYIDYRLVAQFGWREGTLEVVHITDSRAMFYAAANRLDILNAPMNSASVTIPLRPEIRPGYPVYVVFMDCFYYLQSLSHSFQFGGQCTTSLQLTAKRSKFYPPGHPGKSGLAAIDLKNPNLPPRPLITATEDGRPKLTGFPNVVMALDPQQINPLFFQVGADIDDIKSIQTLKNLITLAASKGYGMVIEEDDGTYTLPVGKNNSEVLQFTLGRKKLKSPTRANARVIDLQSGATTYSKALKSRKNGKTSIQVKIAGLNRRITQLGSRYRVLKDKKRPQKTLDNINKQIDALQKRIDQYNKQIQGVQNGFEKIINKNEAVRILVDLIRRIGDQYQQKSSAHREMNSTINLLDALSDKKASFTNGMLPGSYVYYSASHPDPKYQGQVADFSYKVPGNLILGKGKLKKVAKIAGFLKEPKAKFADGTLPEAEIGEMTPVSGLKVQTNSRDKEALVPTSDIKTISFTNHRLEVRTFYSEWKPGQEFKGLDKAAIDTVKRYFMGATSANIKGTDSITSIFGSRWNSISNWESANLSGPTMSTVIVPSKGRGGKVALDLSKSTTTVRLAQDLTHSGGTYVNFAKSLATALANSWFQQANSILLFAYKPAKEALEKVQKDKKANKAQKDRANNLAQAFSKQVQLVMGLLKRADSKKAKLRTKGGFNKIIRERITIKRIPSPIFPVSDRSGYRVIGSYRYGRDVSIEPNGVFDQIIRQDVSRFFTPEQHLDFLNLVTSLQPVMNTTKSKVGNKTVRKTTMDNVKKFTKTQRAKYNALLDVLKKNIPQPDLIRMGLATVNKEDPTQLDFGLANWFATHRTGVTKVPVNNAAYSLADLQQHVRKNICECKTAEADLLIEAFGKEKFVMVAHTGGAADSVKNLDKATKWLTDVTTLQEPAWRAHQNALRGEILDTRSKGLVDTFKEQISRFASTDSTVRSALRSIGEDAETAVQELEDRSQELRNKK